MKGNFAQALEWTLKHEGGISNDAGDPGGLTKWGITHLDWALYCRRHGIKGRGVLSMTAEECEQNYREKYWDGVRGDDLPAGVDFAVFDAGVNSGVSRGIKWLQRALNLRETGKMTQAVIDAAARSDPHIVLHKVCDARLAFCNNLGAWANKFKRGWARRILAVRDREGEKLRLAEIRKNAAGAAVAPEKILTQGDRGEAVRLMQARLRALGYPVGFVDGMFGPTTRAAVVRFQEEMNLQDEPGAWYPGYNAVADTAPHLLPQRQGITADDLADKGDGTVKKHLTVRRWLSIGVIFGGIGEILDSLGITGEGSAIDIFGRARGAMDWLHGVIDWGRDHPLMLLGAIAVVALVYVQSNLNAHITAIRNGDAHGPGGEA